MTPAEPRDAEAVSSPSTSPPSPSARPLPAPAGWIAPFLVFALAYLLSALLRAVTATLAPSFSSEFALDAAGLGLLAGAYFLGFALLQLPLGSALDIWGPRRVELVLLLLAVLGCVVFAAATGFVQLVLGRLLIGMGVAACLMAPLTYFRRHFPPELELRCNSWMLMTGSLGMVASTLPVQLLLPLLGWRGVFWSTAVLLASAVAALALRLPPDGARTPQPAGPTSGRYRDIVRRPEFVRMAPIGLVLHGSLLALQALWIGPWLTQVCGWSATQASRGLLLVNGGMLCAFFGWGALMPWLLRRGVSVHRLLILGVPVSILLLLVNAWLGARAEAWHWAAWCVATSLVAFGQPALAQAYPLHMAGRALSAYNLVIFVGVFLLQWGIGAAIDHLRSSGLDAAGAFRSTIGAVGVLALASWLWFVARPDRRVHNRPRSSPT